MDRKRLVDVITREFEQFCKQTGLRIIVANIDRHGSLEWSCGQRGPLNRLLAFDLTETTDFSGAAQVQLETWITVDDTERLVRRQVGQIRLSADAIDDIHKLVRTLLSLAWREAAGITRDQLVETYLFPHYNTDGLTVEQELALEPFRTARANYGKQS